MRPGPEVSPDDPIAVDLEYVPTPNKSRSGVLSSLFKLYNEDPPSNGSNSTLSLSDRTRRGIPPCLCRVPSHSASNGLFVRATSPHALLEKAKSETATPPRPPKRPKSKQFHNWVSWTTISASTTAIHLRQKFRLCEPVEAWNLRRPHDAHRIYKELVHEGESYVASGWGHPKANQASSATGSAFRCTALHGLA
jgi:hypothetical protein